MTHPSLIENIESKQIEKCIGVMGNPAYKGSYAAPREAFRDILREYSSTLTHAIEVTIEQKKRKYGIMYNDVSPENQEVFGVGFNFALDTILATLKDFN